MKTEWLERLNLFWIDKSFRYKTRDRESYLEKMGGGERLIKVLVGARRVGKTYLLYSLINKLLDKRKKILYLSGEMREMEECGLRRVLEEVMEFKKWTVDDEVNVFIDEVQEIKDWQKTVKFYYDYSKFKFFLTGSSSLVLNQQTEKLTGRLLTIKITPLNYREWLDFREITPNIHRQWVEEYLWTGGYPEYVLTKNDDYLREVVKSTLYRDLLSYYGIRNPKLLEELLRYMADKVTTPVSNLRVKGDLKVDNKTAGFYLKYLEEVYLLEPLYREGGSYRRVRATNPKYYFNDTGVLRLMSLNPKLGYLAENAVFLSLTNDGSEMFYDMSIGRETDFVDKEGRRIEVKYRTEMEKELEEINARGGDVLVVVPEVSLLKNANKLENIELVGLGEFLMKIGKK
jgi:uncharacterized protein